MALLTAEQEAELRAALKKLKGVRIGSERLLKELGAAGLMPAEPDGISRSALDKFVAGGAKATSRKPLALAALYRFLQGHEVYAASLPSAPPVTASMLAPMLARFFTDARVNDTYLTRDLRNVMGGEYVLYRPDWRGNTDTGLFRVSRLGVDVDVRRDGMCVTETQDWSNAGGVRHFQQDEGGLFSYGLYVYFLTRETSGGRLVRLWVVTGMEPHAGSGLTVQWFQGFVWGASAVRVFQVAPFFCQRLEEGQAFQPGVRRLDDLDNEPARAHLGIRGLPRRRKSKAAGLPA
jgi:hypothetical protein